MIKTIIIDDEPLARNMVKEYLIPHRNIKVMAECNDGFEGVKSIAQHKPDVIFLDIQMPKINGFEMLELLDERPAVIFATAFDEYALKAFEAHAVDYLLKPFSKDRFNKAIEKFLALHPAPANEGLNNLLEAASQSPQQNQRIVVKSGNKIKIIAVQDVHYLEAADDYVKIVTGEGFFPKKNTMNHYELSLDPNQFVRAHRSYIINVSQITRIDPYEKETWMAVLKSGEQILVSKTGYAKLKEVLGI